MSKPTPNAPLYVLRFTTDLPGYKGLYYRGSEAWKGVPKDRAEQMTTKAARKIQQHLKQPRIGLVTELEPIDSLTAKPKIANA